MSKPKKQLTRTHLMLPEEWRQKVPYGITLTNFIRDAMKREFKRLKIEVSDYEIAQGKPTLSISKRG